MQAFKRKQGPCFERNQAVIYRGPFKEVHDDNGHRMERGVRYAVCDKTDNLYKKAPYAPFFEFVDPHEDVLLEAAKAFDCFFNSSLPRRNTGRLLAWWRGSPAVWFLSGGGARSRGIL